jgi:hypothetical protein
MAVTAFLSYWILRLAAGATVNCQQTSAAIINMQKTDQSGELGRS